jgi:hypothetical protein
MRHRRRGYGAGRHRRPAHFPAWNRSSEEEQWKVYVERTHGLGEGLKAVYLERIFDHEIRDVGPISHFNSGIMPADLALLRGLASFYTGCSYFEITKIRCESLANMAGITGECYSLSRPVTEMRRQGIRRGYLSMMGYYSRAMPNVVTLSGDSVTYPFASVGKKFDLIFINNGHGYNRILNDTRKSFEYLAHDESVVVWHDYSYPSGQIRYEVLAAILDSTDLIYREQLFFVPMTKCAIFLSESLLEKIPGNQYYFG